jgi:hyperosmotically inducible periplasmic protein
MKHFPKVAFHMLAFALAISLAPSLARAQDSSTPPAPDNTKVNSRDRSQTEPTADQQKENRPDREISRDIRRSIMADKSLSPYAHNVKIISENGVVTLKGPVQSEEEKDKVTNELEVKTKQ